MPRADLAAALLITTVACAAGAPASVAAQSEGDVAAWSALVGTPVGALPPLFTPTVAGIPLHSAQLALRYGHMGGGADLASLDDFAATAILPAGMGATVSLTGGVVHASCDGCANHLILSMSADLSLYSSPLGPSSDAGRLSVALNGEFGYGHPRDATLLAGAVGLPVALVLGSSGMRFVPFVTPAFGFGSSNESGTTVSGSRFLLGGGVGLLNPESSVSLHAGFQQVMISGGKMVFGLALALGGR